MNKLSNEYKEGYASYHLNIDTPPYDYDLDNSKWSDWCDGHMMAYCEAEGK